MKLKLTTTTTLIPLSLAFLAASCTQQKENRRPNILFCIADDASPFMGAYGTEWISTPGFDEVAHEGILFNRAFTPNAKSAPSRSCIITGRNSWQLEDACNHWPYFPAKFRSFMEVMGENGYHVGCTGKGWGPGIALDSLGNQRHLTGPEWTERTTPPPTVGMSQEDYAENFKDFFRNWDRKEPFCFWYGSREPHRGYEYASSIRAGKTVDQLDSVPAFWPDNEIIRTDILDYSLEVEHFDQHLCEILKVLKEAGELDNTLVIVTSDHGMPFPRSKGQAYEFSNHIPLAVMWKDGIRKPGRVCDDYISVIDFAPTILEAAGIDGEACGMHPITGRSFSDILKNRRSGLDRDFMLVGKERHDVGRPREVGYPIRGIYRGDFLYIRNFKTMRWPGGNPETGYLNVDGGPAKTEILKARRNPETAYLWELSFGKRVEEELYNVREDRECMHNLAADPQYAQLKKEMHEEMVARLKEEGDPRMFGKGDVFDKYENAGPYRNIWERRKAGENIRPRFVKPTDFEPGASGLELDWTDPEAE